MPSLQGRDQAAEKYGDPPYEQIYHASKAGNPDRPLALNSWIYPIVTPWQDYWAGETFSIPTAPSARMIEGGPGAGDASAGKGPVTLNALIYQDGTISDLSTNVLRQIRKHLSTGSNQEPAH